MNKNKKSVLVTGSKGFIGSNAAKHFRNLGFEIFGIGHGDLANVELVKFGLDHWKNANVTIEAMRDYGISFDIIIHCGGSGSVGFSVENPYGDFKKTVDGTLEVLEFIRLYSPESKLIYPSSPAVQGEHCDSPILESYVGKPCSPYGYHKKIAEELCRSYSEKYGLKVSIVRLFSVYGVGLRKQLLWDAVGKLSKENSEADFWGTGQETRDFIHIDDVMYIFEQLAKQNLDFVLVNGGTGIKTSIRQTVEKIREYLKKEVNIVFNNEIVPSNPMYYCASMGHISSLIDCNFKPLEPGLLEYVTWASNEQ
ncbi:NAD-dependent epimerase/dehydratase [Glaciecola punicea ACAM 611]|jgi:UDP-glucose 4-epimerase|uniref:NAD-dependent epimerase/dehydratase n=1 Tax=Glaciecola punicea ACAM 611 TaxID=1121923 RepID=H5TF49_9ALTE|nr:SDR family oxidoreductase [Glaciecola punicea]GAB56976.1 NAD-dependent epimerase/dehydratase [Glaciecola punicea ACAM 611]